MSLEHPPQIIDPREYRPSVLFDLMIGRLDRLLSEILIQADNPDQDPPNLQTLKHHAEDLIGVGNAILERIKDRL